MQFQNRGGKNSKDDKQQQQQKHSAVESDTKSESGSEIDENASSASTASNENAPKIHVEFTEAEIIAPESNTVFKVSSIFTLGRQVALKKKRVRISFDNIFVQISLSQKTAPIVKWKTTTHT